MTLALPDAETSTTEFVVGGQSIRIRSSHLRFEAASHPVDLGTGTYNIKPQVLYRGEVLLAELVLVRLAEQADWKAAWIDNFHGQKVWTQMPRINPPSELPTGPRNLLDRVAGRHGSRGGIWDVVAWRRDEIAFLESKGPGDRIGPKQRSWLEAAISEGVAPSAFTVAEWTFSNPEVGTAQKARRSGAGSSPPSKAERPAGAPSAIRPGTGWLPRTAELEGLLPPSYQATVKATGISIVSDNTLRRVREGARTHPSRVKPLIKRGLITEDGQRLSREGKQLCERLDLALGESGYPPPAMRA